MAHEKNVSGSSSSIQVTLKEERRFPPPQAFTEKAVLSTQEYERLREIGQKDPEGYWAEAARELLWQKPFTRVLEWKPPFAKWFTDGRINASENCTDRHLSSQASKTAILWEGEPIDASGKAEQVRWTYAELHDEVIRMTASLRRMGLRAGDRVAIYLPLVPESAVAMLACARAGLTHTVIFGGFSSEAVKDRINDAQARAVITADFGWRKGGQVALLENVRKAILETPSIEFMVTLQRSKVGTRSSSVQPGSFAHLGQSGRVKEYDWHQLTGSVDLGKDQALLGPESLESEHPLFILYTSGTTGKPKGIVHSTGGYLTGVRRTTKFVFDVKPSDVYWCTADIGWITGHSYLIYGPLSLGATIFMYEGAPTTPTPGRFWEMIERHRITTLYTAPTAIRAFMRLGSEWPKKSDLSSLRLLGTVGEPINPEAWIWYHETIGGSRCPIVDTYWQTETGAIVIAPVPGVTTTKPGCATLPLPGYDVEVLSKEGKPVGKGEGGLLAIRKPWPSMARTIWGNPERFEKAYFSDFPGGIYFTGDGARKDEDGYIWCLGRVDDVLNVSGHRLGTMEIESAIVSHPKVAEAAVVGRPDELKGQGIVAFVTLKSAFAAEAKASPEKVKSLKDEVRAHVSKEIGALARPDEVRFTDALPKTRSGKIMRRLLRELATEGQVKGDTTTLEDFSVIASLRAGDED